MTIWFNGIDGDTGEPALAPVELEELAARHRFAVKEGRSRALMPVRQSLPFDTDHDFDQLADVGWGIVVPYGDHETPARLAPLIKHRSPAGGAARILDYLPGEDRVSWESRHGVRTGDFEPTKIPFYLLVAGSPARIPFTFVHQLAIHYAAGYLGFDQPDGYQTYADALVAHEVAGTARRRDVAFWAPAHDPTTRCSLAHLVPPLIRKACELGFIPRAYLASHARCDRFGPMLADAPALVFTASHGMTFHSGHPLQELHHGALLGAEWCGRGPPEPRHHVGGPALDALDARHDGAVVFAMACHSAGVPMHDRFAQAVGDERELARRPLVSSLAQAFLRRGALAFKGHVDRAFATSFVADDGPHTRPFEQALSRLLRGRRVGLALSGFSQRYAARSAALLAAQRQIRVGLRTEPRAVARDLIEHADAEGYILLGDPAARLRTDGPAR